MWKFKLLFFSLSFLANGGNIFNGLIFREMVCLHEKCVQGDWDEVVQQFLSINSRDIAWDLKQESENERVINKHCIILSFLLSFIFFFLSSSVVRFCDV